MTVIIKLADELGSVKGSARMLGFAIARDLEAAGNRVVFNPAALEMLVMEGNPVAELVRDGIERLGLTVRDIEKRDIARRGPAPTAPPPGRLQFEVGDRVLPRGYDGPPVRILDVCRVAGDPSADFARLSKRFETRDGVVSDMCKLSDLVHVTGDRET